MFIELQDENYVNVSNIFSIFISSYNHLDDLFSISLIDSAGNDYVLFFHETLTYNDNEYEVDYKMLKYMMDDLVDIISYSTKVKNIKQKDIFELAINYLKTTSNTKI